jgi:hypothetical protein
MATTVAPTMPVEAASSAHDHHGNAEPAAHPSEQPAHGLEQVLGDAALFQHHAHQHKKRDGDQHIVGEQSEHPLRQRA